jgi:PST family polysaccharide transporter
VAAALQASGSVVAGILAVVVLRRVTALQLRWPGLGGVRAALIGGWHLFVTVAGINLYTSSTVVLVGLLASTTAVGYFAAANKLVGVVTGLFGPVSQAVFPHMIVLKVQSRDAALNFAGKLLRLQGLATFGLSALLFVLAEPMVALLFGAQFGPTVALVELMAALPFIIGLSNVFGTEVMVTFGMDQMVSRIVVLCGVANVVLVVLLVHAFGVNGAAMSMLVAEALVSASFGMALARAGLLRRIVERALGRPVGAPA